MWWVAVSLNIRLLIQDVLKEPRESVVAIQEWFLTQLSPSAGAHSMEIPGQSTVWSASSVHVCGLSPRLLQTQG